MNLKEISDLFLEITSKCSFKKLKGLYMGIDIPNPHVYDAETEGCKLRINTLIVNESSRSCIKSIVEKRKLRVTETQEYLVIYKPRKK